MDLNELFAVNLRRIRKAADISQSQLAKACNVTASYLCQVENGKRNPTLSLVQHAAHALHVSPLALFGEPSQPPFTNLPRNPKSASLDDFLLMFCSKDGIHLVPISQQNTAAVRMLARFMVRGYKGEDLWRRLVAACPNLDDSSRTEERGLSAR